MLENCLNFSMLNPDMSYCENIVETILFYSKYMLIYVLNWNWKDLNGKKMVRSVVHVHKISSTGDKNSTHPFLITSEI